MTRSLQPTRLNLKAQAGQTLAGSTPLTELPRLAADVPADAPTADPVHWQALAEWRARAGGPDQLWLHLQAQAAVPLSCQRCLAPVALELEVDRWFRFVDTEAQAEAEDDESEEDLLVLEPQFDMLALLEDELLMSLPLVPMHGECPSLPAFQAEDDPVQAQESKPHPFAVLAGLKKQGD